MNQFQLDTSQFQFDSLETYIELRDKDDNIIDTIVIPPEEMAMIEAEAKAEGMSVEEFINDTIAKLVERVKGEDVDN